MARDVTRSDIRRMLERLEKRADRDGKSTKGDTSPRDPGGMSVGSVTPSASDHAAAILSDLSTTQLAKFIAIERDFDDTQSDPPDHSGSALNTKPIIPLSAWSKARVDGSADYMSAADKARLEVITGGGEWIDVTSDDMAAARQIEGDL